MNIYTHRTETLAAADFIAKNSYDAYLGSIKNNSYYNVNGVVWSVWQSGTGNYPECTGIAADEFELEY